jgi:hypothetical protein
VGGGGIRWRMEGDDSTGCTEEKLRGWGGGEGRGGMR